MSQKLLVSGFKWIEDLSEFDKNEYCIYLTERPGRSFNFWFSKRGAYSREMVFRGRRSLIISKRH